MPRHPANEELGLIDQNIHKQNYTRPLKEWWCEICGRKLFYPTVGPKPQCPYCRSSKGLLVPMKQYFFVGGK